MKLNKLLVIVLLITSILPTIFVGELSYYIAKKKLFELAISDLQRDLKFAKNVIKKYKNYVDNGKFTKEEAIEEIAQTLCGPQIPNSKKGNALSNFRKLTDGVPIYKSGYIFIHDKNSVLVHPYGIEGHKVTMKSEFSRERFEKGYGWHTYKWKNPATKDFINAIEVFDTFKDWDWILCAGAYINEFISPAKDVRNTTIVICIITIILVFLFSLGISKKIAKPLTTLTFFAIETGNGNLSLNIPTFKGFKEIEQLASSFNTMTIRLRGMITELKRHEEELHNVIDIFGRVLSEASMGNLDKRVDLNLISDDYKPIGKDINNMIDSLKNLLFFDYLTQLYNRKSFYQVISLKIRYGSLITIDIDNFKYVNDTYGHDKGDEVLKIIAQVIIQNSRDGDIPVRWGGDEMLLYLPRTEIDEAYIVAERIRSIVEQRLKYVNVTLSLGIAQGKLNDELIKNSDIAMYEAKKSGKNKIAVYNPQK